MDQKFIIERVEMYLFCCSGCPVNCFKDCFWALGVAEFRAAIPQLATGQNWKRDWTLSQWPGSERKTHASNTFISNWTSWIFIVSP